MELEKLWPYDIEIFPNVFTIYIGNAETRNCWGFEISERKDERQEMFSFLRTIVRQKGYMVGFNCVMFDYPVLHFILKNQDCTVEEIYDYAMTVISADGDDKFKYILSAKETMIPQLDLYKIWHFDNKARATSLKMLEFNMRSRNIEDLPYEPGSVLTSEQIDNLLRYNKHDMAETCKFLMESMGQIEFREELSKKYKKDMLNFNDTKIGKEYFIMKLEESNPGSCYIKTPYGRKIRQTVRDSIDLSECILPYIEFQRPEFRAVKEWFCKQTITETKGVFSDIEEHDLGDVAKYANLRVKKKKLTDKVDVEQLKKEHPLGWIEEKELKSGAVNKYFMWRVADNLNVIVDGMQYDYGVGGLHGAMHNTILESDDKRVIRSFDFASYYPHLSFINRIYPEHFGEGFCDLYEEMYYERKKHAKGTPENAMMKLALNGSYGASNDKFSPFYDPKFTMTITISGQLTLTMLAEWLISVPTVEIVILNTDGLEFIVDREYNEQAEAVCAEFEKLTNIALEGETYKKLCIADVNSYCGEFYD